MSSEFPPQPGGIGNHAFNLASQLKLNGYEVEVLTNARNGDDGIEEKFDNEQTFNIHRVLRQNILITYFKRIQLFRRIVKSMNPDVIIGSGKFALWLVGFFTSKKGIKRVAIVHGSELQRPSTIERNLVNSSINRIQHIISVSNFTKSLLKNKGKLEVVVIPNGFDPSQISFETKNADANGLHLITIGSMSQRKGQHNVIKVLPELLKHYGEITYHVVGIPSNKTDLEKLAIDLKVNKHVDFHGVLSETDKIELLSSCDIFMMLSEQTIDGAVEGFGIALLEANNLGVPTIGSINCGIEDAIDHGNSGVLVNPFDKEAIRNAIELILKNKEHYKNNSKIWALNHQWSYIIKRYISFLEL